MDGDEFSEVFGPDALLREGELGGAGCYAPDGLVGEVLEGVIEGAYAEVAGCLWLTSAVVDGSAAEQCRRRMQRRALGVVVHVLPVGEGVCGSGERRAA
ncbi:MAG: hypothetical protein WCF33_05310 [Pseudonocardiaceae bacterium]